MQFVGILFSFVLLNLTRVENECSVHIGFDIFIDQYDHSVLQDVATVSGVRHIASGNAVKIAHKYLSATQNTDSVSVAIGQCTLSNYMIV